MLRKTSFLYSNQRDEPTCAYHVFSKIVLKNRVELFHPLPIESDVYNTNNCNRYLDTKAVALETLSEEECTRNGVLKIILFHYFFSLYDIYLNRGQEKRIFSSLYEIDAVNAEINRILIPERVSHKRNT